MPSKNKGVVVHVVTSLLLLTLVICSGCQSNSTVAPSTADAKSAGIPPVKASPGVHNIGKNDH